MTEEKKKAKVAEALTTDGEFMLEPVPLDARRSTRSQFMVWIGFGYAVTGLIVGGNLAGYGGTGGMGPMMAFWAIALGMGALYVMTSFLGVAAQKTGYNLALLSKFSYGSKGVVIPLFIMSLLTLGWFASIAGMVGEVWGKWIGNPSGITVINPENFGMEGMNPISLEEFLACAIFGAVFTYTAVRGMSAIEKVATVFSPLILIVAVIAGVVFISQAGGVGPFLNEAGKLGGMGLGDGITIVVGSWIAGAIMGVDMFRFNKSVKAVWLCAAACFVMTNPILNFVGYIGVVVNGEFNYVFWMLGAGIILAILGVVVWTTALWTTDNSELYCNSMYTGPALDVFGVKAQRKTIVIVIGVLGTILGAAAFYQLFFADFINALGAIAPPLAAPILADFFVVGKEKKYDHEALEKQPAVRWAGVISFAVGAVLGFVFQYVTALPYGLPSGLFALLVSFVLYIIIYKVTPDAKTDAKVVAELGK
ncbi:MAG: purine-cytosine permease family protein [Emergencia timonensis]|uniref:purine-cytosine permease family protein n=1 Tax=Emergencia timonensis TaxID=1776384 RepID=UPI0008373704|nr:cytosine permease [Emergencia timonensis]WNX87667.1 cytosine permease [Emergencia timonensis]